MIRFIPYMIVSLIGLLGLQLNGQDNPFACLENAPETDSEEEFLSWAEDNCPEAYELIFAPWAEEAPGDEWPSGNEDPFTCLDNAPETESEDELMSWTAENCPEAFHLLFGTGNDWNGDEEYPSDFPCDSLEVFTTSCGDQASPDSMELDIFIEWIEESCDGPPIWSMYIDENYPDVEIVYLDIEFDIISAVILSNGVSILVDDETIGLAIQDPVTLIDVLPLSIENYIDDIYDDAIAIDAVLLETFEGFQIQVIIELLGKTNYQILLTFDVSGRLISEEELTASGIEPMEEVLIRVNPNPANGRFNLNLAVDQPIDLAIYSITGKRVWESSEFHGQQLMVDCSDWASGLYILQYSINQKVASQKISVH